MEAAVADVTKGANDLRPQMHCIGLSSWRADVAYRTLAKVGDRITSGDIGNIRPVFHHPRLRIFLIRFSFAHERGVRVTGLLSSGSGPLESRDVSLSTSFVLPRGSGLDRLCMSIPPISPHGAIS
jgi:hypothetical protein